MELDLFPRGARKETAGNLQENGRYRYLLGKTDDGRPLIVDGVNSKLCRQSLKTFQEHGKRFAKMDKIKDRLRQKLETNQKNLKAAGP